MDEIKNILTDLRKINATTEANLMWLC